jgi:hypothetical protein
MSRALATLQEAEIRYRSDLRDAAKGNFRELDEAGWLRMCCDDKDGAPVIMVHPESIADKAQSSEELYKHFISAMDRFADMPYSVLVTLTPAGQHLVAQQALLLRSLYERCYPV